MELAIPHWLDPSIPAKIWEEAGCRHSFRSASPLAGLGSQNSFLLTDSRKSYPPSRKDEGRPMGDCAH